MTQEMFELALLRIYQDHPFIKDDFEYAEDWIKSETEKFIMIDKGLYFDHAKAKNRYSEIYNIAHSRPKDWKLG